MSKSHYIIPIFVPHEGCPHDCVFCNQNSITGVSNNSVTASAVKDTIEEYLRTIKREKTTIVEVSFFGGTFTAIDINKQKELLEVAKLYKGNGKIDYIHLSTRPDYIDDDILTNLKDYSVDVIELGIQSMDDEVLIKSGRGHTYDDIVKASKMIKEYGFTLGHQIMLGLPGDTFQKDIDTTKKVINLKPSIARIYPSLVIKDTPMEIMYRRENYKPYSLEEAVHITKIVYSMLVANNINVIRIGLQPTEEINYGKDLIAGPFHPAFRELVEGNIYSDTIYDKVKNHRDVEFTIHVNSKDISKLYAYKKKFFNDMKSKNRLNKFKVLQDDSLKKNELMLKYDDRCEKISIKKYLRQLFKEGNLNIL